MVRWRLAVPSLVGPTAPPFLIEHDTAAAEWTPAERAERAAFEHPRADGCASTSLEIAMVDPARVAVAYRAAIGTRPEPWLDAGDWALAMMVGPQRIVLRPAEGAEGPSVVIRISSTRDRPTTADMFGCRFAIEPEGDGPPAPSHPEDAEARLGDRARGARPRGPSRGRAGCRAGR